MSIYNDCCLPVRQDVHKWYWLSDVELRSLSDYAVDCDLSAPHTLAYAVLLVALLGGYQDRKHDPPPGHQIMWRGYERLSVATLGYRIAEKRRVSSLPRVTPP